MIFFTKTSLHKEYLIGSVKIKLPSVDIIHLRIFAESFIIFVQNCEKFMEKQMYHFFTEQGVYRRQLMYDNTIVAISEKFKHKCKC